ncbi:unnamed protein product [Owenia fusiformis]|uniref:Voltage-dependent T-type calcium channel subunit alpha n=1 Tax=Owenia fusiformis TaxID=6347 RepID=A0A8S4PMF4_OWEFU|nr:unnamed protein product [Owenia fusiformis]
MGVILLNCLTLGMYQPCNDVICDTTRCKILAIFDHFIFAFFAIEMIIKLIAMGVVGKDTYLAETWNRLDMFIVIAGVAEYVTNNSVEYAVDAENLSLSAIRTIRVLRPLRAINRIPSMRILVMLLLDTLPMLGNVLLLCFFVFFIFGIVGVQLWAGLLRNRCFLDLDPNISHVGVKLKEIYVPPKPDNYDYICSDDADGGMMKCANLKPFEYNETKCNGTAIPFSNNTPTTESCVNWNQYYTKCKPGHKNPFQGAISFDNIGLAWVAIFQVISLAGWVNIMYYVQDTHSFWDWIYFVALIVIGSFFMINLCLVVIATQFSETKRRETERMAQERRRYQSTSTLASNSEPGGCYKEILKYIAHLFRKARKKIEKKIKQLQGRRQRKVTPEQAISLRRKRSKKDHGMPRTVHLHHHHHHHHHHYHISNAESSPRAPRASPEVSDIDPLSSPRRPNHLGLPEGKANPSPDAIPTILYTASDNTLNPDNINVDPKLKSPNHVVTTVSISRTSSFNNGNGKKSPIPPEVIAARNAALVASKTMVPEYDVNKLHPPIDTGGVITEHLYMDILGGGGIGTECRVPTPSLACTTADYDSHHSHCSHSEYDWSDSDDDVVKWKSEEVEIPKRPPGCWSIFQDKIKICVDHRFFQRGILIAILINTLSMGIEYHNQPETLTKVLEYSNYFFSGLFCLEMLMKLVAEGLFGYVSNGFNLFDAIIVILSIVELVQGGGGLSVLRTFRLLRILKLVRFMPALRYQLLVMLRTMDNVATFFALLVLFMFIFSVLGMNIFGGKFCSTPDGASCKCMGNLDSFNETMPCTCFRSNFDTLTRSFLTVFQILTQEDWNEVLYNGMAKTSAWAALYFIALMTFGNYVLFNLLVAILVEGFSGNEDKSQKDNDESVDCSSTDENENRLEEENKSIPGEYIEKNNQDKERRMLALPQSVAVTDECNLPQSQGPLNPPIITHTAATPAATPQGSPNETLNYKQDNNNRLVVNKPFNASSMSLDSIDKSSSTMSIRSTPKLHRRGSGKSSRGSLRGSFKFKNNKVRDGDKESLVSEPDALNDVDPDEDGQRSNNSHHNNTNGGPANIPIGNGNTNGTPQNNNYSRCVTYYFSDCNGHAQLNNQRTLSPQNSIKSRLSPKNPIHGRLSRQNSIGSYVSSRNNSFKLSRQNSINSHRTLSPQTSLGSNTGKDEYKPNNITDISQINIKVPSEVDEKEKEEEEDDDPDAADETDCVFSWCPEPKGCFKTRAEYSLYLMSDENSLRKICHKLIVKKWFDYTVLFFIALNCITLAMERPDIPPDSMERAFLTYSNYIFTVIFTFEMTVKVIAKGFIIGKHAYLKSGWNIMDGFLVIISLVDLLIQLIAGTSSRIFGILRVFRLLRTLRPLRVISRAPGLKLVVQTLLSSLRPIGNIVLICCTFFVIFGILGVQLFKGTFYYCKGPDTKHVQNKTQCLEDLRNVWVNHKYNFDNLGQALMALFVLASKDGWVQLMYTGLDAVGVDQQPQENYNEWRLLYFISFLLLVGFFVLNMFVGVVVENFHKCREDQEQEEKAMRAAKRAKKLEKKRKSTELLEDGSNHIQEVQYLLSKRMREPPYWANYGKYRLFIHKIVTSKYFDLAIAGVIGLNVITMAMEFYMMPFSLVYALKIFNYFFTAVFILEAGVKVIALGVLQYFKDRWNQLDMGIVILSLVGIVLEEMDTDVIPINPTIIRVMRVLRIARVLKLLKMAKGIRALFDTVIQGLPQMGNLGLLFLLLFFIFAALGVELFGRLECSEQHPCEGLGVHAHFQNFGMAFLTLFRVATGDNWNGIMKDTLREDCDNSENCQRNCCVSAIIAPVFFVVFVLMAQFVLVNVVVAVLMKHLEESNKAMDDDENMDQEIRDMEAEKENDDADSLKKKDENEGEDGEKMDERAVMVKNANLLDPNERKRSLCKQTSLPHDFTFEVRPPSEMNIDEENPDQDMSPAEIEISISGPSCNSFESVCNAPMPDLPKVKVITDDMTESLQPQCGSVQDIPLTTQDGVDTDSSGMEGKYSPQQMLFPHCGSMPDVMSNNYGEHYWPPIGQEKRYRSQPTLYDSNFRLQQIADDLQKYAPGYREPYDLREDAHKSQPLNDIDIDKGDIPCKNLIGRNSPNIHISEDTELSSPTDNIPSSEVQSNDWLDDDEFDEEILKITGHSLDSEDGPTLDDAALTREPSPEDNNAQLNGDEESPPSSRSCLLAPDSIDSDGAPHCSVNPEKRPSNICPRNSSPVSGRINMHGYKIEDDITPSPDIDALKVGGPTYQKKEPVISGDQFDCIANGDVESAHGDLETYVKVEAV